jgi:hypothetical protein
MTQADENRLKGNYGAAYVAMRLGSEGCLVRPVPSDTDVGVDLFCESVEDEQPFLHFWVQVKTGKQCKVRGDGSSFGCSFEKKHLLYWYRQPVPVFAALVPTDWPPIPPDQTIYVVDVTSHLIENPPPETPLTLYSDWVWRPEDQDSIRDFLRKVVPFVSAKMMCKIGVVAQMPTVRPSYVQYSPRLPVGRYQDQILHQIRKTAAFSIMFMRDENTLRTEQGSAARRTIAGVLAQFENDPHWENFMALAISFHVDAEFSKAIQYYERARQSILGDPRVADNPSWQPYLRDIEDQIAKAQNKAPV